MLKSLGVSINISKQSIIDLRFGIFLRRLAGHETNTTNKLHSSPPGPLCRWLVLLVVLVLLLKVLLFFRCLLVIVITWIIIVVLVSGALYLHLGRCILFTIMVYIFLVLLDFHVHVLGN